MYDFMQGLPVKNYQDLHRWSVDHPADFWTKVLNYFDVIREGSDTPAFKDLSFDSYSWFSNIRLNFAENLLRHANGDQADKVALNALHEVNENQRLSFRSLKLSTQKLASFLKDMGFKEGEVLGAWMPNVPETVISMLACTSFGGVFTSTSCDFGIEGVVDRFGQSKPRVLVAATSYSYNGKRIDLTDKIKELAKRLDCVKKIILVDIFNEGQDECDIAKTVSWSSIINKEESAPLHFKRVAFGSPLYIMYSSGTTGKPKCIVHSVGGTLLQHLKELGLHTDLTAKKNIMFFTTCGWMMWNWLVSSLALGSEVTLYEGSPGYPSLEDFVDLVSTQKVHVFGTSPKFLKALEDRKVEAKSEFSTLETVLSTGAPLMPEQFDFVYKFFKTDLHLASISGGTDIIGCFMLGNPLMPVRRGEIQAAGLGMDVVSYSADEKILGPNQEGELVCLKSFPSRPICFLDDDDQSKMKEAYFNQFAGVWHHGDFIHVTETGGVVVHGRSDATLNPGGVRIGTAEIYRQTESLDWLEDSLCVGRANDGDVDVILFVKPKPKQELTSSRIDQIKALIRKETTPRHVPAHIFQVTDIPYTRSGKKMELAITRILANKPLTNIEAIANPECLEQYKTFF